MSRNVSGYPGSSRGPLPQPGFRPGDFRPGPGPTPFIEWYQSQPFNQIKELNELREHMRRIPFERNRLPPHRIPIVAFLHDFHKRWESLVWPGRHLPPPDGNEWSQTNNADCVPAEFYSDQYAGTPCVLTQVPIGTVPRLSPQEAAQLFTFARWGVIGGFEQNVDTWTQIATGNEKFLPGPEWYSVVKEREREREVDWKREREPPKCEDAIIAFAHFGITISKEACEVRFSRKRDKKFVASIAGSVLSRLISNVGEAIEFAECMYDALPPRAKARKRPRGPQNRLDKVFKFLQSANAAEGSAWLQRVIECFILNQIEDMFFAAIGDHLKAAVQNNPYYVRPVGFQTGNWAWQELMQGASSLAR